MTRIDQIPPGMDPDENKPKARKRARRATLQELIPKSPVKVIRYAGGEAMMTLPYPPSNNTYKRHICTVDARHKVIAYIQDPAKRFLREVSDAFLLTPALLIEGPIEVNATVWRPRPIGDIDNVLKVLLDSLEGKVYANDGQIVKLTIWRFEAPADPRVEVVVTRYTGGNP